MGEALKHLTPLSNFENGENCFDDDILKMTRIMSGLQVGRHLPERINYDQVIRHLHYCSLLYTGYLAGD